MGFRVTSVSVTLLCLCSCGRFGFEEAQDSPEEPDAALPAIDAAVVVPDAALPLSACVGTDSVLCDGFEDDDLSAWNVSTQGGSIEIVSSPVFQGRGAIRARTLAAGAIAELTRNHDPVENGALYMRAYYYFPSSLITPGLIELSNTGDSSGVHTHFGMDESTPLILVNENVATAASPVPRDTWLCVEIDIDIRVDGGGEVRVDGVTVASVANQDTTLAGGYASSSFGLVYTEPAAGAVDVYIDEVAVDTEPIGCL